MTTTTATNGHKTPCQPNPHTLNVHDQRYNAHFYSAIATIMALRQTYLQDRYSIDFASRSIQRLEQQPYMLTVQEDYRRHDSEIPRTFDETPPEIQGNTVVQAALLFKALVFQDAPITPR
ncbi:uncharacterized protein ASPGLDRAFT_41977, partial [Aspergillus glaucus CBS 516.65]